MDRHAARALVEELVDARKQLIHALAGLGADVDAVLPVRADIAEVEVGLVVNAQAGNLLRAELFDELVHDLRLLEPVRVGNVDDVQKKIGVFELFKRCLERLDELMRQLSNEADRVGDHDIQRVGHREKARRRVQRVKQAVIRGNARAGQRVQKRRLARVRVADDGDDGNFILAAAVALRGAHAAHLFKVRLQLVDLSVDVAAVGLKLRFAGALRADGALARRARLALQVRPHTDQARQQVLILRKLDLKPALFCLRPLGEDIENEAAAIEHLHAELFAQNAHLRGREVIVEDDHCRLLRLYQLADLVHLALADECVRVRRRQRL